AIASAGEAFGRTDALKGQKIQVEFVSANPTGPVTVANARGGPIGDVLANVLALSGATVQREYYINDAGSQLGVFGRSVAVRDLGEDIDSVLIRSTGVPTYIGVDIAYHREALVERALDRKIDVWGANTHGHARRMKTAMAALGIGDRWEVLLYQFVRFIHEGV